MRKQTCLNPTVAYVCGTICSKDGVISPHLVFSFAEARDYYFSRFGDVGLKMLQDSEVSLPCGKCMACKMKQRRDLSTRLAHEASCFDKCCFITLTYDDEHLPSDHSLCVRDVQLFLKRLRRHLEYVPRRFSKSVRDHVSRIRYFAVGEYGSNTHRPHYHILVFGWNPSDVTFWSRQGHVISYRSSQVEKLWTNGFSLVQDVSPQVASYCARYVTKKITDDWSSKSGVTPEFFLASKHGGGIGISWFRKYGINACLKGFVTVDCGDFVKVQPVPKYYDRQLRKVNPHLWSILRDARIKFVKDFLVKSCTDSSSVYADLVRKVDCFRFTESQKKHMEKL